MRIFTKQMLCFAIGNKGANVAQKQKKNSRAKRKLNKRGNTSSPQHTNSSCSSHCKNCT